MKLFLNIFVITLSITSAFAQQNVAVENDPRNAIVKINTIACPPSFTSPWKTNVQENSTGTGVVIKNNYILTNAHNIAYATYITVAKEKDGMPVSANVVAVNHQCDLALLEVADKSFFKDITPFDIGQTPPVQSEILVVGYPVGGSGISITQGIISRIEKMHYAQSFYNRYLAVQLDAAINPGNSGGPAIFNNKVVGIIFQLRKGNSLGYMIHTDVIKHFLEDVKDGKVSGFGMLGLELGALENPDMRRFLNMQKHQSGIIVLNVRKSSNITPKLQRNDVITEIDGFKILNNGNIINERGENVEYSTIIDRKQMGEKINLKVLRQGKEIDVVAEPTKSWLKVDPPNYDKNISYFTIGGLVFTPLSISYLKEITTDSSTPDELTIHLYKEFDSIDEEFIVLTQVLGDEVNLGYQDNECSILEKVNGKKIKNIKELVQVVDSQKEGFVIFEFQDNNQIIMDITNMRKAWQRISKNYKIPSDRSDDLLPSENSVKSKK